ncbi:(E2-independent) E3 ubiquitin-conjugating enzyme FATS [Sorex fumeus]|uniref:(E2-independent) E3 ubiquitin-conjugating enzyme FATS n=1 Tax=Sorex fumeus TaxID=62283 RepID=UPI0024AE86D9|nr:(E2-independent) E3 ubiquitin-conjugating enzyme FATS [Sorex fumeus]
MMQPAEQPGTPARVARSGRAVRRAIVCLPSSARTAGPWPPEEAPDSGPPRGFASITITARRVDTPGSSAPWGAAGGPAPRAHPEARAEASRSCAAAGRPGPGGRWERGAARGDHRGDGGCPADGARTALGPLVFSSCVHVRVSRQGPGPVYRLDAPLCAPLCAPLPQPRGASPLHRSVLSLSLGCSSPSLAPDGGGGPASGGPVGRALPGGPQRWPPGLQQSLLQEHPPSGQGRLGTGTCPWRCCLANTDSTGAQTSPVAGRPEPAEKDVCCRPSGHSGQLSIHIPGWSYAAVETKVLSGSNEKEPANPQDVLSAAPVAQTQESGGRLPEGSGAPSNSGQARCPPGPAGSQGHGLMRPRAPLPGCLCPSRGTCPAPLEDPGVQVERETPEGDYTCCDLVVQIKGCERSQGVPRPESTPPPPEPEAPKQTGAPESQQRATGALTLQEALLARCPQFVSRSQERLKQLEQKAQQRKARREAAPKQSLQPLAQRKQFTVPHPLSDNLFKPKERCISEKEMHLRSKRIYNNLPEVKKKKEEQKKRVILQSNRLRAEVFKKQLLDQLLQRTAV